MRELKVVAEVVDDFGGWTKIRQHAAMCCGTALVTLSDAQTANTEANQKRNPQAVPEGYTLVPTEILDQFPEINPSNYDHDDACALNAWGVELVLAAAPKEK